MKQKEILKTTVKLKLRQPNAGKRRWLEEQARICMAVANECVPVALGIETLDKSNIHKTLYPIAVKAGLAYVYAESLVSLVAGQVKSYRTNVEDDHTHQPPTFTKPDLIPFRGPAWKLIRKGEAFILQMALEGGRGGVPGYFPLELSPQPHSTGLDVREWITALTSDRKANKKKNPDGKLQFLNDDWYLILPVEHKLTTPKKPANLGQVFPVDIGLVNHVAMVTRDRVVFLSGKKDYAEKEWMSTIRRRYQLHNRTDRVKAAQGSESRKHRWINHNLSKWIVDEAVKRGCTAIALEDLEGIRNQNRSKFVNRRIHGWSFFVLRGMIEYKAKDAGLAILNVKPEFTSQKCPKCGHTEKGNRATRGGFSCLACKWGGQGKVNADYVAVLNIGEAAYDLAQSSDAGTTATTASPTLNTVAQA